MPELKLSPAGRRYGYLPDPYDSRDYVAQDFLRSQKYGLLKRALGYTVGIKPTVGTGGRFDYIADLAAPEDQGQLGSCTAFSSGGERQFLYRRYNHQELDQSVPKDQFIVSKLFQYYNERKVEGTLGQDSGANMRTAAYCMRTYGFCLSSADPYNVANYNQVPSAADYAQGLKYVSGAYHSITGGLAEMKSVLLSGYCFITGISVYDSFESDAVAKIRIAHQ